MNLSVSVVIPAYNEAEAIVPVLDRLFWAMDLPCEVLVVVDRPDDSTVPVLERYRELQPGLKALVNSYGPGPGNALRYGIDHADNSVVVVTMADGSDDPRQIGDLARLVERGVVVAAASRYMSGGQQVGGPFLKGLMSRTAGLLLCHFARVGTHDATNSFKAYSKAFVQEVGVHSSHGFELGIELTAKARRLRQPVAEIPTIWIDRSAGASNFKMAKWLVHYLRWFRFAFGPQLTVDEVVGAGERITQRDGRRTTKRQPSDDTSSNEGADHGIGRLHRRLRRRGVTPSRPHGGGSRQLLEVRPD